jgi:hypothetical protein
LIHPVVRLIAASNAKRCPRGVEWSDDVVEQLEHEELPEVDDAVDTEQSEIIRVSKLQADDT